MVKVYMHKRERERESLYIITDLILSHRENLMKKRNVKRDFIKDVWFLGVWRLYCAIVSYTQLICEIVSQRHWEKQNYCQIVHQGRQFIPNVYVMNYVCGGKGQT